MNRPDFSIIIPCYNRASEIAKAIDSVVVQSHGNWELLIIDDGSTDSTKNLVNTYNDRRIKYYYQEKKGVSAARNLGLLKSSGHYIIFLDSDDEFLPGLFSHLKEINFKKYDLIFWNVQKILGSRTQIWKPRKLEKIYNRIKATFLAGSVCYKRELLDSVGGFDENLTFGENYELGMRIAQVPGLKTESINKVYLLYKLNKLIRPNSVPFKKLQALRYLEKKHRGIYSTDSFSYSRLLYQIGYLYEKTGRPEKAIDFFKKSSQIRPLFYKPLVKRVLLKIMV